MPQEWETGMVINIQKRNTQKKANVKNTEELHYCPQPTKLFTNVIESRLNEQVENQMVEEQCGFTKGRCCTDANLKVQQIIKKKKRRLPYL